MDTIRIGQLATLQTVHHIHRIILGFTFLIRFLDTTARGGIVMGDRQTYHRAIRQVDGTLYQSLAKGATAHDETTILVLDSASHYL